MKSVCPGPVIKEVSGMFCDVSDLELNKIRIFSYKNNFTSLPPGSSWTESCISLSVG